MKKIKKTLKYWHQRTCRHRMANDRKIVSEKKIQKAEDF